MPTFDNIKRVHVELTDKCNAECPMCVRRVWGGVLRPVIQNIELNLDYFKLLDDEFLANVEYWMLCGVKGDPIACTELVEICKYLLSKNPQTEISIRTNGGFRSTDWWTQLGNLFVDTNCEVMFGIDGLEDTNHLYRKNVKWNKLWDNVMAYNSTGAKTSWQYLIFEHNQHQVTKARNLAAQYNINFFLQEPFGFGIQDDGGIQPINVYDRNGEYIYRIWPANLDKRRKGDLIPGEGIPNAGETDNSLHWLDVSKGDYNVSCKIGSEADDLYIDGSGAIMPCCYLGASIGYDDDSQIQEIFRDLNKFIPSKTNTLSDILSNTFFTETLNKGISGDLSTKPVYIGKCLETCGMCVDGR